MVETTPPPAKARDSGAIEHSQQFVPSDGAGERAQITRSAGIVALGTLFSRLLGLGRELILAAYFSRAVTDAFMVAFTIPNMLRQLLAEGAVQNSVLPVLAKTIASEGEAEAQRFFRALRGLSLLILCAVTLLGVFTAPILVDLFAHGYREHPGQFERTVTLTRWFFPYILFMGTAALGVAALNTHGKFAVTAFAPALLNVAFIVFGLTLPSLFEQLAIDPMMALVVGVLAGGLLQVAAQWPTLYRLGYGALPRLNLKDPRVLEALRRMIPVLFGIGVYAVDVTLARRFLSDLDLGSQSYFGFAMRLCDFPQGIFVMAIQSATLPSLSRLAALSDRTELTRTFSFGLRLSLFVGVAASALFMTLAEPLVALIFERGHFDAVATQQTAKSLVAQGAGIWLVAAIRQLIAVYYAVGDTRTPVMVSALDLGVFIALALWLKPHFGHVGIGMAVTGASLAQALLLSWGLRRHLKRVDIAEIATSIGKTVAALIPAALAAHGAVIALNNAKCAKWLVGSVGLMVFSGLFLVAAAIFRSEELKLILRPLWRRISR